MQLRRLQKGGEALAAGDLTSKVNTSRMYFDLKRHGENLNAISRGMSIAVEQRLKSERLKTELITNVSHDIKTPLTSIVNYVDLLQREHTPEQEREQFLYGSSGDALCAWIWWDHDGFYTIDIGCGELSCIIRTGTDGLVRSISVSG